MTLKPEQLSEMFGATFGPTASLAFEAAIDTHFDILFNHSAAGTHGREFASNRSAQRRRDQVPIIDAVAIAQDVTKEGIKFQWPSVVDRGGGQRARA